MQPVGRGPPWRGRVVRQRRRKGGAASRCLTLNMLGTWPGMSPAPPPLGLCFTSLLLRAFFFFFIMSESWRAGVEWVGRGFKERKGKHQHFRSGTIEAPILLRGSAECSPVRVPFSTHNCLFFCSSCPWQRLKELSLQYSGLLCHLRNNKPLSSLSHPCFSK